MWWHYSASSTKCLLQFQGHQQNGVSRLCVVHSSNRKRLVSGRLVSGTWNQIKVWQLDHEDGIAKAICLGTMNWAEALVVSISSLGHVITQNNYVMDIFSLPLDQSTDCAAVSSSPSSSPLPPSLLSLPNAPSLRFFGHRDTVVASILHSCGNCFSASLDATIRIWDQRTLQGQVIPVQSAVHAFAVFD